MLHTLEEVVRLNEKNTSDERTAEKGSSKLWYLVAIIAVVIIIAGAVYYYEVTRPPNNPGTSLTLYEGEISSNAYGFGTSANSLQSNPGPTITLTAGQKYTMTVHNVGTMEHNWAIVDAKSTTANVLWGAVTPAALPGASGKITFTAGPAGSYFYICQVPGHVDLGLWGTVTVNP